MIDKWYEKVLMVVCVVVLGLLIGCASFQNAVTPAWIDKTAIDYVADINVPCDVPKLWWTSISDAETVNKLLDYSHDQRQVVLNRAKEDDLAWYSLVKDQHATNLTNAYELKTELFTPEGTVGLLLSTGLGFSLGAIGISKPKDKREIETLKNGKTA